MVLSCPNPFKLSDSEKWEIIKFEKIWEDIDRIFKNRTHCSPLK